MTTVTCDARSKTGSRESHSPPAHAHLGIVGGGIIGLAVAREMLMRQPRRSVCVIEREAVLGSHQTGHNSGVMHSGIYYRPGSLKARLCLTGARALYEHCATHGIPHRRCGKLIVALNAHQLPALFELERRGRANGLSDIRRLSADEITELEPHCRGVAALHCPYTGIVDFRAVALSLAGEVVERGGTIVPGCQVTAVRQRGRAVLLEHALGETEVGHAILCAGAWSDRLALSAGADADPRIVPFRGSYLRVLGDDRLLVRALIYPLPDPDLPFLGVHLTRQLDGGLLIGPTALPAMARDGYRPTSVNRRDLAELLRWPGTWRMARR
ncbi:MAG: L-2-hydroxyglutarate oxidase, partial [Solirubrobacteraceae bacterium]